VILLVLLAVFALCVLIGVPLAFSLGISSFVSLLVWGRIPLRLIVQRMFTGLDSFTLMAIPFFMLAGELMMQGGMLDRLVKFAEAVVGRIRGAMGHVNVLASMFFAGITGSATADVAALGPVEIAMMKEAGYEVDYSAAITAASATIGPIIPPSIPMVVYAVAAGNVSIAGLFLAGFIPGVLLGVGMMVYHYFLSVRKNYPYRRTPISFWEFLRTFREAILALLMPAIILFGVLGGIFTATEASAVAVAYALIVGFFVTKQLNFEKLRKALLQSGLTTGMALFLIATANIFSWILATQQVPQLATNFFLSISKSPYIYLLLVNLLLFGVGCVMDNLAALIIFTPILAPIATMLGINPIHFGLVVSVNLVIGLLTPPVGLCLFMACTIARIRLEEITRKIWPFLLIETGVLMLITYVPDLVLTIPRLLGYVR
jgi:tripartite ATP-independent transporter DctM subunit